MRVTILTLGTRGDVQPFLAFGLELERAGYRVYLATHPKFEPLVQRVGLGFEPLAEDRLSEGAATSTSTSEGRRWMESDSRRLPLWVGYIRDARSVARRRLADALRACQSSEAIIASDLATLLGWQMSEHYGVPLVSARSEPADIAYGWLPPARVERGPPGTLACRSSMAGLGAPRCRSATAPDP